jgi:hypothetical protein
VSLTRALDVRCLIRIVRVFASRIRGVRRQLSRFRNAPRASRKSSQPQLPSSISAPSSVQNPSNVPRFPLESVPKANFAVTHASQTSIQNTSCNALANHAAASSLTHSPAHRIKSALGPLVTTMPPRLYRVNVCRSCGRVFPGWRILVVVVIMDGLVCGIRIMSVSLGRDIVRVFVSRMIGLVGLNLRNRAESFLRVDFVQRGERMALDVGLEYERKG